MNYIMALVHGHSHNDQPDYRPQDEPPILNRLLAAGIVGMIVSVLLMAALPQEQKRLAILVLLVSLVLALPRLILLVFVWRYGRKRYAVLDTIIARVPWRGDEQVLDVGTGNGILLTGCAKQLTTGKATGVDVWGPHSGGGDEANFWRNVQAEGVKDRVELHNMDARQMTFADESFDLVTSSLALHHIGTNAREMEQAVHEMWRVLKPGGTIALFDAGPIIKASLSRLRGYGLVDVREEGTLMKFIIGRKPV